MFYRRKIILALIESFGGTIEKIALQKLLFLFVKQQNKAEYDFIPYHFGCYSFSANADLTAMVRHGFLEEDNKSFTKIDKAEYKPTLLKNDILILQEVEKLYGKMSSTSLMKHTYVNYNYYAINSKAAQELLSKEQYDKINSSRPISTETILFTIGYEGCSLEAYLNKLIKNDIKLLIDVRNNPLSMKFGFSKSQLKKYCESLDIQYIHIPQLGIQSKLRQQLSTQNDYDNLFKTYKKETLRTTKNYQEQILDLLVEKKRAALTCFEANICQCHRKHLADAIISLENWKYQLKHI